MEFLLDFGSKVDMLTKRELTEALAEDARARMDLTGVKPIAQFRNLATIGAAQLVTTFQGPAAGYIWSVMSLGLETAGTTGMRLYVGKYSGAMDGSNRLVAAIAGASGTCSGQFSKGQVLLRSGEVLNVVGAAGGTNYILSAYMVAIQVPAERIGELLL